MNAYALKPAWGIQPAKKLRMKGRQWGFAVVEAVRRPGLPLRVANAQTRFEQEARRVGREWLML